MIASFLLKQKYPASTPFHRFYSKFNLLHTFSFDLATKGGRCLVWKIERKAARHQQTLTFRSPKFLFCDLFSDRWRE
jgi:hypothetical protein